MGTMILYLQQRMAKAEIGCIVVFPESRGEGNVCPRCQVSPGWPEIDVLAHIYLVAKAQF